LTLNPVTGPPLTLNPVPAPPNQLIPVRVVKSGELLQPHRRLVRDLVPAVSV